MVENLTELVADIIFRNIPAGIVAVIIYSYIPGLILASIATKDNLLRFILAIPFAVLISVANAIVFELINIEFDATNALLVGFVEAVAIWSYRHKINV